MKLVLVKILEIKTNWITKLDCVMVWIFSPQVFLNLIRMIHRLYFLERSKQNHIFLLLMSAKSWKLFARWTIQSNFWTILSSIKIHRAGTSSSILQALELLTKQLWEFFRWCLWERLKETCRQETAQMRENRKERANDSPSRRNKKQVQSKNWWFVKMQWKKVFLDTFTPILVGFHNEIL